MKFEEWDRLNKSQAGVSACEGMEDELLADWETEREKLIGALKRLMVFEDDHDAAGTEWYDAQKVAVEKARAILREIKK